MDSHTPAETGLIKAKEAMGSASEIARLFGITRGAVAQWEKVPAERVPALVKATGIPHHELRPDIFPNPQGEAATK